MIRTPYARNQAFRVQALAWSFCEEDNLKVELYTPVFYDRAPCTTIAK